MDVKNRSIAEKLGEFSDLLLFIIIAIAVEGDALADASFFWHSSAWLTGRLSVVISIRVVNWHTFSFLFIRMTTV